MMGLMQLFFWRKGNLRLVGYFKNQLEIRRNFLNTRCYEEGHKRGYQDGLLKGMEEGRELGMVKGSEVGGEVS